MKSLALSLILGFAAAATAVQPGTEAWLQSGLLTPELIVSLKNDLGLSPDQQTRMTAIVTEAHAGAEDMEKNLREQQKALNQLLRQPATTPEAASAALTRLLEAEAPVKQLQLRTLLQLRDVLTPEQQKKAVTLAPSRQARRADLESRVREKAAKLKAAVDSLGIQPTDTMKARGTEIETLLREGDLASADKVLDKLIADSGVNEPESTETPDFSKSEPGDTSLDALRERYESVLAAARELIHLPRIRRLLKARDALEQAKAAEDAVAVGRILTWAESELK